MIVRDREQLGRCAKKKMDELRLYSRRVVDGGVRQQRIRSGFVVGPQRPQT